MLKFVFLPLSLVFGILVTLDMFYTKWYFGYFNAFSASFFLHFCVIAVVACSPIVLIPVIFWPRRIPASVRLALANVLFVSICLLVPVLSTHCIWRRRYREVNGFLWVHELFFKAPPWETTASVAAFEPLSICDDEFFFVLFVFDHALMMVSRYILPMMVDLPPKYFVVVFSVDTLLLWFSAFRISTIFIDTCSNHPESRASAAIAKLYLPLGCMMHLALFLLYIFTSLFFSSQKREQNKKWLNSFLRESLSTTRIHLEALLRINNSPKPRLAGTFWSRTEFLYSVPDETPLLLPASVGLAFKVSHGLKDFALYVWALSLPIYFSTFEILRFFIAVDPHIRGIVHLSAWKCLVLLVGLSAPHYVLARAIHQGRVRSPISVTLSYFAIIILCVMFALPGATGSLWNRNFRFLPYFIVINVAPPTILRAISHFASSTFIVSVFMMLHM
jgi:hypothetical protein